MNKVLGREVPINLNDDAIRSEYERVKAARYATPERAHVFEILVRFDPRDAPSKEAARTKIDEALVRIKGGAAFRDVASSVTEGPARDRGGDLGVVSRGDLTPALDQAIFGGTEALTAPVELKDGWAVLSVADRQKASFRSFDDVKEDLRKRMSEEIYDKKFGEYLVDLRKASFVKILDKDLAVQDDAAMKVQGS
jgi:parvulin-like peptidyl-prolyl isomerase